MLDLFRSSAAGPFGRRQKRARGGRLPVTVVTGFLGAGKTTLLNRLVRRPEMARCAVVINEFGAIPLDHELVERVDENMIALASGCLCCTVRGDLIETLGDLWTRRESGATPFFDRVVIETTGLADPAPILHSLMSAKELVGRFRLEGVISLVDGVVGGATLDAHTEAVKQAAVADRLVLTKTDLATDAPARAKLDELRRRLRALNPAAPIIEAVMGDVDPSRLLDAGLYNARTKTLDVQHWLNEEAYRDGAHAHGHDHDQHDHGHDDHDHGLDVNRHDDHIRAFCMTREAPVSGTLMARFVDILIASFGERLLRVKGILNLAGHPDRPAVIHGVQHVFHPLQWLERWPSDDRRTRLVFITRDVEPETVETIFRALERQHEAA
jgi:G3E family GTPase